MPADYGRLYSAEEIAEHAAIVSRRRLEPAHAELWRPLPGGGAVLCVIADDHPGFLSTVSAVLYLHELDVVTAQIYCRKRTDGVSEAVDLFWVRPNMQSTPHKIQADEIASVKRVLGELVVRQACPDPTRTPASGAAAARRGTARARVLRDAATACGQLRACRGGTGLPGPIARGGAGLAPPKSSTFWGLIFGRRARA